jgi:hypothetical protein
MQQRKSNLNDMTSPESTPTAQPLRPGASSSPPEVSVDLTSELRWFFDERPPDELVSWFTDGAATGLTEVRWDSYYRDDAVDVGVKRRYKEVLELKVRRGPPETFSIAPALEGWLETWQRWSPADGRVHLSEDAKWIDVHKTITKRRFTGDGGELPLSEDNRAMTGHGCDVEIATISIEGRTGWTFAFAAFGPVDRHRSLLELAWAAILSGGGVPASLRLHTGNSFGYPAWLTKSGSDDAKNPAKESK